ncbi:hypothetical protein [Sneathiella sp.]|uniref:hypothetical protein n=1 Tax=Sneathiella sp. TaxID=1964365 RepID=UPI0025E975C9|nr:hypothetical protein [Sneathiella sp.]
MDKTETNEESERQSFEKQYNLIYSVQNMGSHAHEILAFGSTFDHAFGKASRDDINGFISEAKLLPTDDLPIPFAYQEFQAVNARTNVLAQAMQELNARYQALAGRESKNGFQPLANYPSIAHALAAQNGLSLDDITKIENEVEMPKGGGRIQVKAYHLASGKDGQDIISRHYELWVKPASTKINPFIGESTIYKDGVTGGKGSEKNGFDPKLKKPRYAESEMEILLAGAKQSADFADLNIINVTADPKQLESNVGAHAAWQNDEYKLDYTVEVPVSSKALQSLLKHKAIVDYINSELKQHASLGAHTNANSCGNYIMALLEEAAVLPRPDVYDAQSAPLSVLPLDALEVAFLFTIQKRYPKQATLTKPDGESVDLTSLEKTWFDVDSITKSVDSEKLYLALPKSPSFFDKYCAASAGYLYTTNKQLEDRSNQQLSAALVHALLTSEVRKLQEKDLDKSIPLEVQDLSKMEEVE